MLKIKPRSAERENYSLCAKLNSVPLFLTEIWVSKCSLIFKTIADRFSFYWHLICTNCRNKPGLGQDSEMKINLLNFLDFSYLDVAMCWLALSLGDHLLLYTGWAIDFPEPLHYMVSSLLWAALFPTSI